MQPKEMRHPPSRQSSLRARRLEVAYAILLCMGIVLPYMHFVPWLVDNGPDISAFVDDLFANDISSFFGWDVLVAAVVLLVLSAVSDDLSMRQRVLLAAGALLGSSIGLPLYLWLRERNRRLLQQEEKLLLT